MKKFELDPRNGKFMGVCAGIANYTGINVTAFRIGLVVVTVLGAFPWTLIGYGVAAWLAKPNSHSSHHGEDRKGLRTTTYEIRTSTRDVDRRLAEAEAYVAGSNSSLAQEIERLR